uniref:EB domain-containing protein n=1 Tax=Timema shepardi TaxID=629360 RepID=A0A7R9B8U2_TIMSH|nr:unnamed protein product [Timema shepardi]
MSRRRQRCVQTRVGRSRKKVGEEHEEVPATGELVTYGTENMNCGATWALVVCANAKERHKGRSNSDSEQYQSITKLPPFHLHCFKKSFINKIYTNLFIMRQSVKYLLLFEWDNPTLGESCFKILSFVTAWLMCVCGLVCNMLTLLLLMLMASHRSLAQDMKQAYRKPCGFDSDCVDNAYCVGQIYCLCKPGFVINSEDGQLACLQEATHIGDACTADIQCSKTFGAQAQCLNNGTCGCREDAHFMEDLCYRSVLACIVNQYSITSSSWNASKGANTDLSINYNSCAVLLGKQKRMIP